MQTYPATQQKIMTPSGPPVFFANSQALVATHQLSRAFDHVNPHALNPRTHITEVEFVESGISAMNFQQRLQGFSANQHQMPIISDGIGSFSTRPQRPDVEHLELSNLSLSPPSQWNVQSPIQSGDSMRYMPSVSRQMYAHNDARDVSHAEVDSGDRSMTSPSALSPDCQQQITPPTCSKNLLPEFSQEPSPKKKLFLGSDFF